MYKDYIKSLSNRDQDEHDYFSKEFYAEVYAMKTGVKLVNSPCEDHVDCGSRCCIPLDSDPDGDQKFCQVESEVTNPRNAQTCIDFEKKTIQTNIMLSIAASLSIIVILLMIC